MTEQEEFEFRHRFEMEQGASKPAPASPSFLSQAKQQVGNAAAGTVRGFGSIGATLLAPVDAAARAVNGGKPITVGGYEIAGHDRRTGMDGGFAAMGAQPDSLVYQGFKLGGEVTGTLGAGGAVANVLSRVPGVAVAAPNVLNAIRTGGMVAPGANIATRTAGGAVNGLASAALVNPDDALQGGLIGAATPGVLAGAGRAGQAVGNVIRGPQQTPELAKAVQSARNAGFVIPPTQANPTLANRLMEGMSGKITTAQNASARNAGTTSRLAAKELGLPADTVLTPDVLNQVRQQAGQAYQVVRQAGDITPSAAYDTALDAITADARKAAASFPNDAPPALLAKIEALRSPKFGADGAVSKISSLREEADAAYRQGDKALGKGLKAAAGALEDQIDAHLVAAGAPADVLQNFRDARKTIAKTYSVQNAANPATGSIDARKLASQLAKGKPLSGGLKDIAEFAARFPKASQTVEGMGSLPQTSPLDWFAGAGLSAATANPLMLAGVAARPMTRAAILSPMVQNRLVQSPRGPQSAANVNLLRGLYQAAPLIGADQ